MTAIMFRIAQWLSTRLEVSAWSTSLLLVASLFHLAACDGTQREGVDGKPSGPEHGGMEHSGPESSGPESSGPEHSGTESSGPESSPEGPGTPSSSSVELTAEQDAQIPAGPPGSVSVSHGGQVHVVEWKGTRDDTIQGYEVYRRCPPGEWVQVGRVELRRDDEQNRGAYRFEDKFNADCEYTVAAVGPDGKPGPKSADT